MRVGLRGKILLITIVTPLTLGLAAFVTVHRNVREHVDSSSIHESLDHTVLVFESMLGARGRALAGGAEVIARDPRFFSLLTLGVDQRDSRFVATVRGMAKELNGITQSEVFEVYDRRGRALASAGAVRSTPDSRGEYVARALRGKPAIGVAMLDGTQYQMSATPVRADGRVVGVLLLGSEIGERLAHVLRAQMRSEVTFLGDGAITGTTLELQGDRRALLEWLDGIERDGREAIARASAQKVRGEGMTYVTVVRRLPGTPLDGRQFYVMQRAFDPEAVFLQQMQRDLALLGLIAVLAAALTGIMLSENITRPIRELVRGAQEMQQGNYTHPVRVRTRDEIGFLADRFTEMRQREQVYVNGLEEAARLKSEFISVASHELRTPISVIDGYRDLLASGTLGPVAPQQQQALDAIRGCLARLTQVAEHATHIAQVRGERLEVTPESQELEPVIERAVGAAVASAPSRRVQVGIVVPARLGPLDVDAALLQQALTNLVSNGIRFTADGGRVGVRVVPDGAHVEIVVTDEGPGIPEDRLERLFDHGHSVRDSIHHHSSNGLEHNSRGLGLGLGITRGIVEAHGGTIRARNRAEGGSEFTIRLPRHAGAEIRDAA